MSQDTRDRLVQTARKLFWEQGYTGTGIAQILKGADAGSGSLYYFFPTKEDLLSAVLEQYKELLWPEVVQPVFDRVSDPIERIFGILDGYRRLLESTGFLRGCPIGNLALELAASHPTARQLIAENFTGWLEVVERCLDDASGRLPESVDRHKLALFVLTTMEGAVTLARTYRSISAYDAAVTQLRDYFDRLLQDGTNWSAPRMAVSRRTRGATRRNTRHSTTRRKEKR
jgi:TetR/AcrR family transcriptional repressor of nem operon